MFFLNKKKSFLSFFCFFIVVFTAIILYNSANGDSVRYGSDESKKKVLADTDKQRNNHVVVKDVEKKNKKNKQKNNKVMAKINIAEVLRFNDKNIVSLIDEKSIDVAPRRKILVNVKDRGVLAKCLPSDVQFKVKKRKEEECKILARRKKILKAHIEKSLVENNVSKEVINYVLQHLKYRKSTKKQHIKNVTRKMGDFIKKFDILNKKKIGKNYKEKYSVVLSEIEDLFNVDADIIVAIWGMETTYGSFIGNNNAFEALYSACINAGSVSRLKFFEDNIIALAILVDHRFFEKDVPSSFDGGVGGCQFMPINFHRFAVSYSGDKPDIVNNNEDVFASIANYLHSVGWRYKEGVLTEIDIPDDFNVCLIGMNTIKTVSEWKELGVKLNSSKIGARYFDDDLAKASIIVLDQNDNDGNIQGKRAFLVYDNYKVILAYNGHLHYGIAAGLLFDGIGN